MTSRVQPARAAVGSRRRRGRGERAGLESATILAEARSLVARHGLSGLTMRALADRLGVAPNALYGYFADKDALVDALLDALLAEVPLPDPGTADWRIALRELMRSTRRFLLAHADLIPLFLSRPTRGPSALRVGEVTLALLARAGIEGPKAVEALRILLIYSFGFAAFEAPRLAETESESRRVASEAAFAAAPGRRMRALSDPLARHPGDETFDRGLDWLLAGIRGQSRSR